MYLHVYIIQEKLLHKIPFFVSLGIYYRSGLMKAVFIHRRRTLAGTLAADCLYYIRFLQRKQFVRKLWHLEETNWLFRQNKECLK